MSISSIRNGITHPSILRSNKPKPVSQNKRYRNSFCLASPLDQLQQLSVDKESGFEAFPEEAAIYGVYNADQKLQYIGITRKLRLSVMGHSRDLPLLTKSIRFDLKPGATKEHLTEAWKAMIEGHIKETGEVPPGNVSENHDWQRKRAGAKAKPELRLTPGKGIDDLTVSILELLEIVIKSTKVVAFIKGTRTEPKCGFSYQMLSLLNRNQVDYEVVDVLDELHNPGVKEAIKEYSQWPTIPQLYINGEFVGGADILTEMQEKGELEVILNNVK